jgi:hypothetical protein
MHQVDAGDLIDLFKRRIRDDGVALSVGAGIVFSRAVHGFGLGCLALLAGTGDKGKAERQKKDENKDLFRFHKKTSKKK